MAKDSRASTLGIRELLDAKIDHRLLPYDYAKADDGVAMEAARQTGIEPEALFKTLAVKLKPEGWAMVLAPADKTLALKRVAKALGVKAADMMPAKEAERLTGYTVGGISPFGIAARPAVLIDDSALVLENMVINAGKRGLLVELAVADVDTVLGPKWEPITAA